VHHVKANLWAELDESTSEYGREGEPCRVEIERTDPNEVRVSVHVVDQPDGEYVDLYLTDAQAARLAHALGAALLT
jgi:hypothetical protein